MPDEARLKSSAPGSNIQVHKMRREPSSSRPAKLEEPHHYVRLCLRRFETLLQVLGVWAVLLHYGARTVTSRLRWEVGLTVCVGMLLLTLSPWVRYRLIGRASFLRQHWAVLAVGGVWLLGACVIAVQGASAWEWGTVVRSRANSLLIWSECLILLRCGLGLLDLLRTTALVGWSPAFMLAATFFATIAVGTLLLTLPVSRASAVADATPINPYLAAVFTATSATCVTGLVVVDTGTYWSRTGQIIILCLDRKSVV